jgi:sigma-B regulation protein RsbU (phosphoserine phosphatase)
MLPRLRRFTGALARVEKVFLGLLAAYGVLAVAAPRAGVTVVVLLLVYVSGLVAAISLARRMAARVIWRLRNRLIVAYLFIAVVPVALVVALVGIGAYMVIGQTAVYLVSAELHRRTAALLQPAETLVRGGEAGREELVRRLAPMLEARFPEFELVMGGGREFRYPEGSTLEAPPAGWKSGHGIAVRQGRLFAWAHAREGAAQVTIVAPLSHAVLSALIPGLGDVNVLRFAEDGGGGGELQLDAGGGRRRQIPAPYNRADFQVAGVAPVRLPVYGQPGVHWSALLTVYTRISAVLGVVFEQRAQWSETALTLFVGAAVLFLVMEIVSLVVGVSITRTVTGAVHELYLGTMRVKEGDFSHRIPVRGNDQLAELGHSFNTMTGNLERLIVVAKEKERLQSEIEIAREVQEQLFPKAAPELRSLAITGACHPARMVSGDYYDFVALSESVLAFAIGDVAGKGISAALLMAAIQSAMRTQLTAAGSGGGFSTARMVANLNRQLHAHTSAEKYATFFFGLYDGERGVLRYTNAGHLPPLVMRGGEMEALEVTGLVVGAFPFAEYEEKELALAAGDTLVAYTDGIVEPENAYGEMFGEERLRDLLAKHAGAEDGEMIARVMEAVEQWTGSTELQDDMTMLVARRL